jgi:hypothetical protein
VGARIGIHEKTEIWREIYVLKSKSGRKNNFNGEKIEVRVYI